MPERSPYLMPEPGVLPEFAAPPIGLMWLRIYAGIQTFLNVLVLAVGVYLLASAALDTSTSSAAPADPSNLIAGIVMVVIFTPFVLAYLVGIWAPRRRWMHAYGIGLCCAGFVCGGCWMLAIPTLVYWLKPEVRVWLES